MWELRQCYENLATHLKKKIKTHLEVIIKTTMSLRSNIMLL